jgi:protein tyrosine phosphatase
LQGKNRYEDVLAFDYNRVLLHHEDSDNWKYINASGIKADPVDYPEWQYIVTQACPLTRTQLSVTLLTVKCLLTTSCQLPQQH